MEPTSNVDGPAMVVVGGVELPKASMPIKYSIHSCSSHSAAFHPRNILLDKPKDQSSRWSSGSNNQPQYIIIELDAPAVVREIKFGKFEKQHVCNLKEFEVYGGVKTTNMIKLLTNGLKNDSEPETFKLAHTVSGSLFPVKYIKIVPLLAWGSRSAHFNYSIWHVALFGVSNSLYVEKAIESYQQLQAKEAIRLCLKYFRQRNYSDSFEHLQKRTKVELESPVLTELYTALVKNGDFTTAEEIIGSSLSKDMLQEYISKFRYKPEWELLKPVNADGTSQTSSETPGMRGGHQMCIDSQEGKIYLFGGWEGQRDLGDLWVYDIKGNQWTQLSSDTEKDGGPDRRSCHKMVLNDITKQMFVLGKYTDTHANVRIPSSFYRYDIKEDKWVMLMKDTLSEGGPDLIYDHQMCIDSKANVLYVFGGRVSTTNARTIENNGYSGLYKYDCASNTWTLLRNDMDTGPENVRLESRIGHSMLLDLNDQHLLIFAGQRAKQFKADFYKYSLNNNSVVEVCPDCSKQGGPYPGFTQRATIDQDLGEVYVLSGIIKEMEVDSKVPSVRNSLWVYDIKRDSWYCAYQNDNSEAEYWTLMNKLEPCPRFAHQFVYDTVNKVHYLFGGNDGEASGKHTRLSDFWKLQLHRPSSADIIARCRYLIRRRRFKELCVKDSREAMRFLQTDLSAVVNHTDEAQCSEFQALTLSLFQPTEQGKEAGPDKGFEERTNLFEALIEYFPKEMKQPQSDLVDLIPLSDDV